MGQQPIFDVGAGMTQPFFGDGIVKAYHSSFIQLVGDLE
jgi:hypothetical protein